MVSFYGDLLCEGSIGPVEPARELLKLAWLYYLDFLDVDQATKKTTKLHNIVEINGTRSFNTAIFPDMGQQTVITRL